MDLALSIIFSSSLFLIFKWFDILRVDNFQAIVINYLTAYLIGSTLQGNWIVTQYTTESWMWSGLGLGLLFITLFQLIARITQEEGVSIAVLSNKMSLIIPVLLGYWLLSESLTIIQFSSIVMILAGIFLAVKRSDQNLSHLKWPLVLFIGSGILDFLLNLNQTILLQGENNFGFVGVTFFGAFIFGFLYWVFKYKKKTNLKNIVAGIGLGIPNYFSIYFLMRALNNTELESTSIFPINNAGILVLSTLLGVFLFREKLTKLNWLGLAICAGGILVVGIAT